MGLGDSTWERIGTGYNYCNDYIDKDDALKEYKKVSGPVSRRNGI